MKPSQKFSLPLSNGVEIIQQIMAYQSERKQNMLQEAEKARSEKDSSKANKLLKGAEYCEKAIERLSKFLKENS